MTEGTSHSSIVSMTKFRTDAYHNVVSEIAVSETPDSVNPLELSRVPDHNCSHIYDSIVRSASLAVRASQSKSASPIS